MDDEVSFGHWLKIRRKALDLTRGDLAKKIGYSVSALRKIESDERRPSKQFAEFLADALEIPEGEQPVFMKIARGERSIEGMKSSPPLPDFSLLQSSQTFSPHIPIPLSPLIGRESELGAVRQMLGDPQCRLITLVGPGGIGKTRLAIEAAHNQSSVFMHGTAFVSLASVNSINLIIPAIANALNFKFHGTGDSKKQLLNYLREKHIFLILDNLEHLLEGVEIIGAMIEHAPQIKVLCTSREQLKLHGEWVFEIRGLSVPESEDIYDIEKYNAVTLFLECAQRTRTGFILRPENQSPIVRICQLVEGMPLAIELAATWVRILSCKEILQEIERGIDFLAASVRDLPERHRSMQAVFDHSWKLLSEEEKRALSRLSVFHGGFTRDTGEKVAGATLTLLFELVAKSLVQGRGEKRYTLHELVRQYAFAQLHAVGEVDQMRMAHLRAFVDLAEVAEPELTGSELSRWLAYLETEHDNLRAALRWAIDSGDAESSLRLTGALWRFWHLHSHFAEGSQWLEQALQVAGLQAPAALRAKALNGAGFLAFYQNHFDQSIHWLEECLAMQSHMNELDIANAQLTFAMVSQEESNFSRAWELYEQALQSFRRLNDENGILRTLNAQGTLAYDMADFDAADRLFGEVLALARKGNDKDNMAVALVNLGWTAALRGDDKASDLCREALALIHDLGSKYRIAFCLEGIAAGIALSGQPRRAMRLFGAANALRETIGALPSGANARYLEVMLQPARDALPEAAFVSAWAEGEAMPLEQAIECALEK